MPAAAAIALRYIIMAAVQLGMWWAIEKYGIPLLNELIVMNMTRFGVPRETAQKIVGNQVLRAFEEVGIFALTLKSKLPIKTAETLGFTSRGFTKAVVSKEIAAVTEKELIMKTATKVAATEEIGVIANSIAKARGINVQSVNSFLSIIGKVIGIPTAFFFAFAQYIDFANWQGPYQKYFQRILSVIGIKPDTPLPNARVISSDTWKRIEATIEELHPIGIAFPVSGYDKMYNRQNLADVVDEIAANIVKNGGDATYKNVIGVLLPLIQLSGAPVVEKPFVVEVPTQTATTQVAPVKVFIGTVSQGYLSQGNTFTPRENDLIESTSELVESAHNNLVPFITSLPSRITYELKVVSSIVTADGFRRVGSTQQVVSGIDANGKAKYRTVTNKFAVLDLYVKTSTGSRSKLSSIVLGPVDSVRLQIAAGELADLSRGLQTGVVTTQTADISNVASVGSTITPPANSLNVETVTPLQTPGMFRHSQDFGSEIFARIGNKIYSTNILIPELVPNQSTVGNAGAQAGVALQTLKNKYGLDFFTLPPVNVADLYNDPTIIPAGKAGPEGGPDPIVRSVSFSDFAALRDYGPAEQSAITLSKQATTLRDYFAILGAEMPSIEIRAVQYENLGLGSKEYYTGTAEQNTKLLAKLQGK